MFCHLLRSSSCFCTSPKISAPNSTPRDGAVAAGQQHPADHRGDDRLELLEQAARGSAEPASITWMVASRVAAQAV